MGYLLRRSHVHLLRISTLTIRTSFKARLCDTHTHGGYSAKKEKAGPLVYGSLLNSDFSSTIFNPWPNGQCVGSKVSL